MQGGGYSPYAVSARTHTSDRTSKIFVEKHQSTCYKCLSALAQVGPVFYFSVSAIQLRNAKKLAKTFYVVSVDAFGETTLFMAMHLPKEFKTFLLKMTPKVLESFGTSDFDFTRLTI
jgi:hypothetical protein